MVRHHAVRKKLHAIGLGGTQKFNNDNIGGCGVKEMLGPLERAHR